MSDKGVGVEIGRRIRALRLRKNMTQQELARAAALSLNAIKAVETGKGKLLTLIAVLRELGALEALDQFIPELPVSPLQLAKQQGQKRHRASGKRRKTGGEGEAASW
ncbi:MAG: helix-turn-helix transcriptional regulator [Desulfatitalea sp.]|nr:helix-turn-helix transcriptional regulator [Desulfatitalea sp.]